MKEDIIKKHKDKFSQVSSNEVIHAPLECSRCICETEMHDPEFMPIAYSEYCFLHILVGQLYMVITGSKIKFGEVPYTISSYRNSSITGISYLPLIVFLLRAR